MERDTQVSRDAEMDILYREERCRKALKTVSKAVMMRILVTALLLWTVFQTAMELWIVGLILFVVIINLAGMLPLIGEWKKQRVILKEILDEEDM